MGFGLIGILIAIAIIAYMMVGAGGQGGVVQQAQTAKQNAAETRVAIDTQQIAVLVAQHHLQNDEYPESPADLGMENHPTFKDAWGRTFRFELIQPTPRDTPAFYVISDGEDGLPDTADDERRQVTLPY